LAHPKPVSSREPVCAGQQNGVTVIVCGKCLQSDTQLMQVVDALYAQGFGFGLRNRGEQNGGEDSDDGDDHQQLNEGESVVNAGLSFHNSLDSSRGRESRCRAERPRSGTAAGGCASTRAWSAKSLTPSKVEGAAAVAWSDLLAGE
jgi:hypothetical protein